MEYPELEMTMKQCRDTLSRIMSKHLCIGDGNVISSSNSNASISSLRRQKAVFAQ